ncbi:hypothetical protein [Carnobacterium sp. CS13]|uniref:hypothetical protein n=1 Tax=Carnobacterium sp. CS13 TaxID=2800128 RepID=UPI001F45D0FF|nr:hypothetical protein [Carnobacterium sp. CS13]
METNSDDTAHYLDRGYYLVLLVHASADKLSASIVDKNDSFRSQITINILCNVLLMSIFMTVIGSWIGQRGISLEPI